MDSVEISLLLKSLLIRFLSNLEEELREKGTICVEIFLSPSLYVDECVSF